MRWIGAPLSCGGNARKMYYLIKFARMIDAINEWTGNVFRFIVILLMLLVSYEVIMRYILVRPSEWGQEINGFLLLGLTFLGGGYGIKI